MTTGSDCQLCGKKMLLDTGRTLCEPCRRALPAETGPAGFCVVCGVLSNRRHRGRVVCDGPDDLDHAIGRSGGPAPAWSAKLTLPPLPDRPLVFCDPHGNLAAPGLATCWKCEAEAG